MALTHYDVLGVSPTATREQIREAWKALVRANHPDNSHNASEAVRDAALQKTSDINAAWTVLGDETKRMVYDLKLMRERAATQPRNTAKTQQPQGQAGKSPFDDWVWQGSVTVNFSHTSKPIKATGDVTIEGKVLGNISSWGVVSIKSSGHVKGDIEAKGDVVVQGEVEGNITAQGKVAIKAYSDFKGNIVARGDVVVESEVVGNISSQGSVTIKEHQDVKGDIVALGDVTVNGKVSGNVTSLKGKVTIGPFCDVAGKIIAAGDVLVRGKVGGDVSSQGKVTTDSYSHVKGGVVAKGDVVAEGRVDGGIISEEGTISGSSGLHKKRTEPRMTREARKPTPPKTTGWTR